MNRATRRDAMAILTAAGLSLTVWPAAPTGAGEHYPAKFLSGKQL